jgi:hypothetical protein
MPIWKPVSALLAIALVANGCGDGQMSLSEYGERIDALAQEAGRKGEELLSSPEDVAEFTPQVLQAGLERGTREIRIPLQEAVDQIEPPDQLAELHDLMWGWHAEFIDIEQALAARAGETPHTDEGWTALSNSPEMAAYRAGIAEGKQICIDFQERLDASESAGAFADTPWIPQEMSEVVDAVLGCQWFPENPEDVYLYP